MKQPILLFASSFAISAMELPQNTLADNQGFAVHDGSKLVNSTLDAYEGKILVVMLMTPWCPSCQSNANAVGDGVLDHFNAASRGVLRGKNNHGIEIESLLLSTEPAPQWDGTNLSFATSNGYGEWGLDADAQRQSPRVMLGYFRGGYPNNINSGNLYDWGEDRRRVIVLSLVRDSASHGYREIVLNQNSFTAGNAAPTQALINAIQAPPAITSYDQWASGFAFPPEDSDAFDDPDDDGSINLWEFFHGTHPLQATSRDAGPSLTREAGMLKLVYRRAKNIGGFTLEHRSSALDTAWLPLSPELKSTDLGTVWEIEATLPPNTGPAGFYQLSVTLP